MKKWHAYLYLIILLIIESAIFIILYFTVSNTIIQSVFGIFTAFSFIVFTYFFILFVRSRIALQKSKDPIKIVGENNIRRYYNGTKKVNLQDLILIKKAMTIKKSLKSFIFVLINIAFSLGAFFT